MVLTEVTVTNRNSKSAPSYVRVTEDKCIKAIHFSNLIRAMRVLSKVKVDSIFCGQISIFAQRPRELEAGPFRVIRFGKSRDFLTRHPRRPRYTTSLLRVSRHRTSRGHRSDESAVRNKLLTPAIAA